MTSGKDEEPRAGAGAGRGRVERVAGDLGGAFGDLGTFLPHALGAITVAGLAPVGVLASFGILYVATGLFYRLPIPVQPMKAVSAVLITSGLSAGEIAAAGLCLGLILVVLGATGAIGRFARIVPQSVVTGLQLGLGVTLALVSLELMAEVPWLAFVTTALLLLLLRAPRCPATLIALGAAIVLAQLSGIGAAWPDLAWAPAWPAIVLPGLGELQRALGSAVLPQLPLTLTNAVIVTAALAQDSSANAPPARRRATSRSPAVWPISRSRPSAPCRCATAPAASRRITASAPAPAWRRCCSASCCSASA